MTAPAPEEEPDGHLAAVLAALVAALLAGAAVGLFVRLLARLAGVAFEAVSFLLRRDGPLYVIIEVDRPNTGAWTEPQYQQWNQNVHRRASYLVNAARRVSRGLREGGIDGMREAYEREQRYWAQHQHAGAVRTAAAELVGLEMQRTSSVLLGWHAKLDSRTSPECRAAHGRNFDPNRIPPIGYPGSVHPFCRCRPGVPFATRRRVEDIRPDHRGAA